MSSEHSLIIKNCFQLWEGSRVDEAEQCLRNLLAENTAMATDALFASCEVGSCELCNVCLDQGADINNVDGGFSPLSIAIRKQNVPLVGLLLNRGADTNLRLIGDATSLFYAIEVNGLSTPEIVTILLSAGADPNAVSRDIDELSLLMAAAKRGRIDVVELLVRAGADPTFTNNVREDYTSVSPINTKQKIIRTVKSASLSRDNYR